MEYIKVLEKVSESSNGIIFRGKHLLTNKIITIKEVKLKKASDGIPASTLREISILKELKHANIICLRNVIVYRNQINLLYDFIAMDLKTYLNRLPYDYEISRGAIQSYLHQISTAIEFCHQRRIFHRNLCPQNVLLNRKGTIKITDFGTAQSFGIPRKIYTIPVAILHYRSPEILLGSSQYSPAIDVWSIGCIFAELFLRKPLFQGVSEIDQLRQIVEMLGYQDASTWKDIEKLPHYFSGLTTNSESKLKSNIKGIKNSELHLMKQMLKFNPFQRISAKRILKHQYFAAFNPSIRIPTIF